MAQLKLQLPKGRAVDGVVEGVAVMAAPDVDAMAGWEFRAAAVDVAQVVEDEGQVGGVGLLVVAVATLRGDCRL